MNFNELEHKLKKLDVSTLISYRKTLFFLIDCSKHNSELLDLFIKIENLICDYIKANEINFA